jgi:hypothetical protein
MDKYSRMKDDVKSIFYVHEKTVITLFGTLIRTSGNEHTLTQTNDVMQKSFGELNSRSTSDLLFCGLDRPLESRTFNCYTAGDYLFAKVGVPRSNIAASDCEAPHADLTSKVNPSKGVCAAMDVCRLPLQLLQGTAAAAAK